MKVTSLVGFFVIILASCTPTNSLPPTTKDYQTFWADNTKLNIELTLSQSVLAMVQEYGQEKDGPYNDYYFPATFRLTMNEQVIELPEVGIRQKGNVFSRGPFTDEQGRITRPFHFRLSFDQTFHESFYQSLGIRKSWTNGDPDYETRQRRRLFTMKSLELKWNRSEDPSLVNQLYASNLYHQFNALAPDSTLGSISLMTETQGQDLGVYFINEAVDLSFIEKRFTGPAAQGDLYKALFGNQLLLTDMARFDIAVEDYVFKREKVGVDDTENFYHPVYALKTNELTSTHAALMRLVKTLHTLNDISDLETRKSTLESVVDIESFLKYAAISYVIGNPDDMRNLTNNTYIYFHGVNQKAYFIPYDMDWSLGLTWDEDITDLMATHSPLSIKNSFDQTITNPLYWYTILDGYVSQANRYPRIDGYQSTYLNHVATILNDETFSVASYQSLYQLKRSMYGSLSFTIESASTFRSIELFTRHHQRIKQTNTTLLNR